MLHILFAEMTSKHQQRYSAVGFVCRVCSQLVEEKRHRNKMCRRCGLQFVEESIAQMQARHGAIFEKWLSNIVRGITEIKK